MIFIYYFIVLVSVIQLSFVFPIFILKIIVVPMLALLNFIYL